MTQAQDRQVTRLAITLAHVRSGSNRDEQEVWRGLSKATKNILRQDARRMIEDGELDD